LAVRSPALARKIDLLRNHGMVKKAGKVLFPGIGLNLRFTEIAAALGSAQLARLPAMLEERARQAEDYRRELHGLGLATQLSLPGCRPNWQSLVARLPVRTAAARDRVLKRLQAAGIQCTIGTYFLPTLPAFRDATAKAGRFEYPGAAAVFREAVSLPLFSGLKRADITRVAASLRTALEAA
jgi:dTDP-4-amino-4,6-dideoxygalactose transaminase